MGVYEDLGLEPIINVCGSVTRLGGAPMPKEVVAAFAEAATLAVPLEQLQAAASRRIALATGTEAGLVTAGAAAGLTLGAAAIMTGHDLGRMERLPDTTGMPNEFIVAREQRNGYDHAVRAAGARLVEVGFHELSSGAGVRRVEAWEYEAAITERTAGIFYVLTDGSRPPLEEVVALAHRRNLPVLVDAAAELPPRDNLRLIPATGADLVAFSGGKAIQGPQSSGILCGRRDLIAAAALQMLDMDDHRELWSPPDEWIDPARLPGIPRHGIGRGLKVSKEEIVALLVALRLFVETSPEADRARQMRMLERVANSLKDQPVACHIARSSGNECFPVLSIHVNDRPSALRIAAALRSGAPPVYVGHSRLSEGILLIHPLCLREDQVDALCSRLRAEIAH